MTRITIVLISLVVIGTGLGCAAGLAGGTQVNENGSITDPGDGGSSNDNSDGTDGNANDNVNTNGNANDNGGDDELPPFTLTSRNLLDGDGMIDLRFARFAECGGNEISPQLSWTNAPAESESYVVVIFDSDAANFIHWIVFDIAASVTNINEGGPAPGGQTLNDYEQGLFGYGGPCAPAGETHTYVFRVYALDFRNIGLGAGQQRVSLAELESLMSGNILDQAEFTAAFGRP